MKWNKKVEKYFRLRNFLSRKNVHLDLHIFVNTSEQNNFVIFYLSINCIFRESVFCFSFVSGRFTYIFFAQADDILPFRFRISSAFFKINSFLICFDKNTRYIDKRCLKSWSRNFDSAHNSRANWLIMSLMKHSWLLKKILPERTSDNLFQRINPLLPEKPLLETHTNSEISPFQNIISFI